MSFDNEAITPEKQKVVTGMHLAQLYRSSVDQDYERGRAGMENYLSKMVAENRHLRELLASHYSGFGLYRDDQELQDNREHPPIDFRRMSATAIARAIAERARKRFEDEKKLIENPDGAAPGAIG